MISTWINVSLSITTLLATTAVTASLVTLGLNFLVRDHNLRKTVARFHRRRKLTVATLRDIETAFNALLPAVMELRATWSNSPNKEGQQLQQPPADASPVTPPPSDEERETPAAAAPSPKRRKPSVTDCKNPVRSLTDVRAAQKRLLELEEQAMRLLETLDSTNPNEMAADLNLDATSSSTSSSQSCHPSSSSLSVAASSSSSFIPSLASSSAFMSTLSPLFVFDSTSSVRLDAATETLVRAAVDSCRERKKTAVGKLLELVKLMDAVTADVSARATDRQSRSRGSPRRTMVNVAL